MCYAIYEPDDKVVLHCMCVRACFIVCASACSRIRHAIIVCSRPRACALRTEWKKKGNGLNASLCLHNEKAPSLALCV